MSTSSLPSLGPLYDYTACDISDALLKLGVPGAGFIADLSLISPSASSSEDADVKPTIAPASTVVFSSKAGSADNASLGEANIPSGKHWVDLTQAGTIVVLSQPRSQKCAVLGGIMALRMKVLEASGVVVLGRVRDIRELRGTGLPIWAQGTSTVGSGAEAKPHSINVPVTIDSVTIKPGDIVFSDPANGVVVIPREQVQGVIELLPKLVAADDRVKEDVEKGMSVKEAFAKHRG